MIVEEENVVLNAKNIFTKKESNNIMKKEYNLLSEREGLCMKEIENLELNEVLQELNFIEKIFFKKKFIKIYKKGIRKGFNCSNFNVR